MDFFQRTPRFLDNTSETPCILDAERDDVHGTQVRALYRRVLPVDYIRYPRTVPYP